MGLTGHYGACLWCINVLAVVLDAEKRKNLRHQLAEYGIADYDISDEGDVIVYNNKYSDVYTGEGSYHKWLRPNSVNARLIRHGKRVISNDRLLWRTRLAVVLYKVRRALRF